jgi:hypothetical protein
MACDALFFACDAPKMASNLAYDGLLGVGYCESVWAYQAPINRSVRSGCSRKPDLNFAF